MNGRVGKVKQDAGRTTVQICVLSQRSLQPRKANAEYLFQIPLEAVVATGKHFSFDNTRGSVNSPGNDGR